MESNSFKPDISYLQFDHNFLKKNVTILNELAEFYCSIWMYDDNFGEYRICPTCKKYYNENDVEVKGIVSCSGDTKIHPKVDLVLAWEPNEVIKNELLGNSSKYGKNFLGIFAVDNQSQKIIGFTWGWLETAKTIRKKWEKDIANLLDNSDATYYSDIANHKDYRNQGIGRELCVRLSNLFSKNYPELPSFLRTHQNSPAKTLFKNVGYQYFANDPEHGDGRIMMMIKKAKDLNSK